MSKIILEFDNLEIFRPKERWQLYFVIVADILGSTNPWLVITKKAIPLIGDILSGIKDRDFGFISMDEEFGPHLYKC